MALVECIPNFSEGRRPDVIAAIVEATRSAGAFVLDVSSDADHHRTVVTFAAEPQIAAEAAYRAIRAAAERIDLDQHSGQHPRLGAADVIPFVPLRDCTLADCVTLAHDLGQRVGQSLGLPVYFYEAAALRPERVNLADVRRGGYEALRTAIADDPARLPDAGPARVGPAGAVIIGARGPLIAFNAYLDTADVAIAQAIAVAVRESGGGLPALKALGLLVKGQAQVSMNIVDFRRTSLFEALEAVRREALRRHVRVTQTELVGLVPQAALVNSALAYLQLPAEAGTLLLEARLGETTGDFRGVSFE